jgi:hypothetical protein
MTDEMTTTAKPIQTLRTTGRELLAAPADVVIAVDDMTGRLQPIAVIFGPEFLEQRSHPVRNS